ncbi:restriction endonuclease subunit S [Staphylococcus felis]|nr:restriction endonuclease subunit S [Staphylococcus felis]REH94583.1 restriction endonuclease subunit S [Staphylococcus felis]REI18202.1 restriction endonuclease subunit S [Staphylococcus felis]REI21876.1 restriction endonuclease subunit S [Staphylococcus felis]REI30234.1 restriction endonuclease subunit S [Staphylococcus felis]REI35155.1 restriction endonuclease subunit S [Staphylococcus felis]
MSESKRNIPELRFPEFTGEWEEKKLGEIVEFSKGKYLGKKDLSEKGVKCILYGELYTKYGPIITDIYSSTNADKKLLKEGKYNQILIPSSGETSVDIATASSIEFDNEFYIGGDINILEPKIDKGTFISLSLNGVNKLNLSKYAQGKSVVHIYNNDIKKLKISMAVELEEQEKIGTFFSKLDRLIELEEKKYELLEQQKRGYMQKIFSQELRFKDENGNDYPEWEVHKLGTLYKIGKAGGTPKSTERKYYNGEIPFLSISDITEQGKYIYNTEKSITQEGLDNSSAWLVPKYSINYAMYASVGYLSINKIDLATSQAIFNMYFDDYKLTEYVYYYLNYIREIRLLEKLVGTNTQSNLSALIMRDLDINLTINEERYKIIKLLNFFDFLNKKQSSKIKKLKHRKKALLQKMFV